MKSLLLFALGFVTCGLGSWLLNRLNARFIPSDKTHKGLLPAFKIDREMTIAKLQDSGNPGLTAFTSDMEHAFNEGAARGVHRSIMLAEQWGARNVAESLKKLVEIT